MSEWYEPKDEDISIDKKRNEVDIFVKQNYFGAVYVTLTVGQVRDIVTKLERNITHSGQE